MPKADNIDFAKELKELEAIVGWFESEEVDLNAALPKFERDMELAAKLRKHLSGVENKVEVIKKKFSQSPNNPAPGKNQADLLE